MDQRLDAIRNLQSQCSTLHINSEVMYLFWSTKEAAPLNYNTVELILFFTDDSVKSELYSMSAMTAGKHICQTKQYLFS